MSVRDDRIVVSRPVVVHLVEFWGSIGAERGAGFEREGVEGLECHRAPCLIDPDGIGGEVGVDELLRVKAFERRGDTWSPEEDMIDGLLGRLRENMREPGTCGTLQFDPTPRVGGEEPIHACQSLDIDCAEFGHALSKIRGHLIRVSLPYPLEYDLLILRVSRKDERVRAVLLDLVRGEAVVVLKELIFGNRCMSRRGDAVGLTDASLPELVEIDELRRGLVKERGRLSLRGRIALRWARMRGVARQTSRDEESRRAAPRPPSSGSQPREHRDEEWSAGSCALGSEAKSAPRQSPMTREPSGDEGVPVTYVGVHAEGVCE